ncbi:polysaccharide deacetylase family protein [Chloroflexota bacterium]
MQKDDLITLGSHTVNHDVLYALQPDELMDELGRASTVIEDVLGIQIDLFAFPNGQENDINQDALVLYVLKIFRTKGTIC